MFWSFTSCHWRAGYASKIQTALLIFKKLVCVIYMFAELKMKFIFIELVDFSSMSSDLKLQNNFQSDQLLQCMTLKHFRNVRETEKYLVV